MELFYFRPQLPEKVGKRSLKDSTPGGSSLTDGKHIRIATPPRSGTDYHNYKGYSSIILLAIANHDYSFTYADVGAHGRCSDAGVWRECSFNKVSNCQFVYW